MRNSKRFVYETRPLALKQNILSGSKYRFTVLTESLIRMEYSQDGVFEDRASQTVFFRDFPKVNFKAFVNDGVLTIETENLLLTYRENSIFSQDTLSIKLKTEPASIWNFGDDLEDLYGTARTLDEASGSIPLGRGVCSRNGFSVIDDSKTMLLNDEGWVEVRKSGTFDCYFFGYGFRYLEAVKDFYRLTGAPPMLPAYALGNWWSRYHKYTQEEYEQLILKFEKEEIPFSVSVVDMDWHITKIPEELKDEDPKFSSGWTGYTWNKELFPDYKAFLKFLKKHNLKTALNLHPACGVCRHEEMYREMAEKCGIDADSGKRIPLDILSPEFMENYFDVLHHPYEENGVDFWWMDWQQGTTYWWIHEENKNGKLHDEREVLDPLWMLNHLHIADIRRNGKRPMFFSRYSGPGSQRYPVGFSGDTFVTWESLDFQPYFTATASNIGYSWWSHDIGGHGGGYRDDELLVRWIELGVFSPINRLHSSCTEFIRKEPWCFEEKTERIIKKWLNLRHRLFPYIYTMNYRNHKELEPLVQPMYYKYPKNSGAYEVKNQFMFGSELIVAPITKPDNKITRLGNTDLWLPKGDWFDFFSGIRYSRNRAEKITVHRELGDYPVFAKAGAIVPMQKGSKLAPDESIKLIIFPGNSNSFTLYEDAGEGSNFEKHEFAETVIDLKWCDAPTISVKSPKGDASFLPKSRNWEFNLRAFNKEISVKVFIDGKEVNSNTEYCKTTNSVIVSVTADITSEIKLIISGKELLTDNGNQIERCIGILQRAQCKTTTKERILELITDEKIPFIERLTGKLNHACIDSPEHDGLLSAIKEQLTLEDIDYTSTV